MFQALQPDVGLHILDYLSANIIKHTVPDINIHGIDVMSIPYSNGGLTEWLKSIILIINSITTSSSVFYLGTIWVNKELYPPTIAPLDTRILSNLVQGWTYSIDS